MELWDEVCKYSRRTDNSTLCTSLTSLLLDLHLVKDNLTAKEVVTALTTTLPLCNTNQSQVKWCQLASSALNTVQARLQSADLNRCVSFTMQVCQTTNYLYCTVEALGALLYNAPLDGLECKDALLGEDGLLLKVCSGDAPEREVQHLGLRCMNNVLNRLQDEDMIINILTMLMELLTGGLHGDALNRSRLVSGAMRCLQTLSKNKASQNTLKTLFSAVKGYMFEGMSLVRCSSLEPLSLDDVSLSSDCSSSKPAQPRIRNRKGKSRAKKKSLITSDDGWSTARPTQGNRPNSTSNKGGGAPHHKPQPQQHTPDNKGPQRGPQQEKERGPKDVQFVAKQTDFTVSSSESELSDESSEEGNKVSGMKARTRLSSLLTLQNCIHHTPRTAMYNVWCMFLPPDANTGLMYLIHNETNQKCRIAALGALTTLIEASKHYFLAADTITGTASYTPFSHTLGTAIVSLHTEFLSLTQSAPNNLLPHLLQALAVLVINTPFTKLTPGIISQVLEVCVPLSTSSTLTAKVQGAALNLMSASFSVETPLAEVTEWLGSNTDVADACIYHIKSKSSFQQDALQVICQLLRHYFSCIQDRWEEIAQCSRLALQNTDLTLQNMALLALEELGKALAGVLESGQIELAAVQDHWESLLTTIIVPILQQETSLTAPGACDILSTIGNVTFSNFQAHSQRLIITLLLSRTCPTPGQDARSSACRALGVLVTYPCLREDLLFVADTANSIITALTDSNCGMQLRASWALGNLSDSLVVNKSNSPHFVTDFSDVLLGRLFSVSLKAASENDKVRSNVVRALGNLLRFVKQSTYDKPHFVQHVSNSVECLLKCSTQGMMKTRWNSCYAIVNMLHNPVLTPANATWAVQLFTTLTNVMRQCKNFKVRINATLALSTCFTRACYGQHFIPVWVGAVESMIEPMSMTGSQQVYIAKLRSALLVLLCHLTRLHAKDDRVEMRVPKVNILLASQCYECTDKFSESEKVIVSEALAVCEKQDDECLKWVQALITPPVYPDDRAAFGFKDD